MKAKKLEAEAREKEALKAKADSELVAAKAEEKHTESAQGNNRPCAIQNEAAKDKQNNGKANAESQRARDTPG